MNRRAFFFVLLAASACSDDNPATPGSPDAAVRDAPVVGPDAGAPSPDAATATADAGQPIQAAANTWTWVDFPNAFCDEGTTTGVGVNKSDTSDNLLIYFEGGGACWNFLTCFQLMTSVHGPFGETQFNARSASLTGSLFDRALADNPFKDWNYVYIPYCTSDIHGGDNIIDYTSSDGNTTKTVHHVGHDNVLAYLGRLIPTFPSPPKLVVSGASAGGFGAAVNYASIRTAMTPAKSYLLDDSGPLFEGDDLMPSLSGAWIASWKLDELIDSLCGSACNSDFSAAYTALSTQFPNDRLMLLSSLQDATIRTYFLIDANTFQTDLLRMATDVIDPLPNMKYFFVSGQTHTMIGNLDGAAFTTNSTSLTSWISTNVNDGTFVSLKP